MDHCFILCLQKLNKSKTSKDLEVRDRVNDSLLQ